MPPAKQATGTSAQEGQEPPQCVTCCSPRLAFCWRESTPFARRPLARAQLSACSNYVHTRCKVLDFSSVGIRQPGASIRNPEPMPHLAPFTSHADARGYQHKARQLEAKATSKTSNKIRMLSARCFSKRMATKAEAFGATPLGTTVGATVLPLPQLSQLSSLLPWLSFQPSFQPSFQLSLDHLAHGGEDATCKLKENSSA